MSAEEGANNKRRPRAKPTGVRVGKRGVKAVKGPMTLKGLIASAPEITDTGGEDCPVVLMTRIRFARNLAETRFPGWAKDEQRQEVWERCRQAVGKSDLMRERLELPVKELTTLEKQVLIERHLISKELAECRAGSGVIINRQQNVSVMVNEEDHLRIQVLSPGFKLREMWKVIDGLDTTIEETVDYAFSRRLGYLTACPTNLGTAMRASAMMHLPALVISGHMERVVRAVAQFGMVVRGLFGESSEASGSIFQISNQTSLGESEEEILRRLGNVLSTIIKSEADARGKLVETDVSMLQDKVGRAYGILQNSHVLNTSEAMNLLSLLRLGTEVGIFPAENRRIIDRLFIEAQPGHVQNGFTKELEPRDRDVLRAERLREVFGEFPKPGLKQGA